MARRILIVEDDGELRRFYKIALRSAGYETQDVGDGMSALHLIDQWPPDLVLLDLDLPTVSGFTVQQDIVAHGHTREIPIVIATGIDTNVDGLNVRCVLRKPVSADRLVETVRNCLRVSIVQTALQNRDLDHP